MYNDPEMWNAYDTPAAFIQFASIDNVNYLAQGAHHEKDVDKNAEITIHLDFTNFDGVNAGFKRIDEVVTRVDMEMREISGGDKPFQNLLYLRESQPDNVSFHMIWTLTYGVRWRSYGAKQKILKGTIEQPDINANYKT